MDNSVNTPQKIKFRYRKKYRKFKTYFLSTFVRMGLGKHKTINMDVIDQSEPFLLVTNHRMIYGPLMHVAIIPMRTYPLIDFKMLDKKIAKQDMASGLIKNGTPKWLANFASGIVSPIVRNLMMQLDPIAVYRDNRIVSTLKNTVDTLASGKNVVISPENWVLSGWDYFRKEVAMIEEGTSLIAGLYYKKTGKPLNIYCALGCKEERVIRFAKCENFDHTAKDAAAERTRHTLSIYNLLKQLEQENKKDIENGIVKTKKKYIRQEKRQTKKELKKQAKHSH